MRDEKWGVGNKIDAKAFDKSRVGNEEVELIFGEHPHSRQDNDIYARFPDGDIYGFNGHRVHLRVEVSTSNYLKTSYLSGDEVRRSASCKIYMNDFLVYAFNGRDPLRLLRQVEEIVYKLYEFSGGQLWKQEERDRLIGRKVYYQNVPATITNVIYDEGCICLRPEKEFKFPIPAYIINDKDEHPEDYEYTHWTKVDFFSKDIWWWRE